MQPEGLGVIARASSMTYKGHTKTISQIGRELGVQYVLDGSVRREADRVRISMQLVRVGDQAQLWAETFDRELRDILTVQNEVARQVARAIELRLSTPQQARLALIRGGARRPRAGAAAPA